MNAKRLKRICDALERGETPLTMVRYRTMTNEWRSLYRVERGQEPGEIWLTDPRYNQPLHVASSRVDRESEFYRYGGVLFCAAVDDAIDIAREMQRRREERFTENHVGGESLWRTTPQQRADILSRSLEYGTDW